MLQYLKIKRKCIPFPELGKKRSFSETFKLFSRYLVIFSGDILISKTYELLYVVFKQTFTNLIPALGCINLQTQLPFSDLQCKWKIDVFTLLGRTTPETAYSSRHTCKMYIYNVYMQCFIDTVSKSTLTSFFFKYKFCMCFRFGILQRWTRLDCTSPIIHIHISTLKITLKINPQH